MVPIGDIPGNGVQDRVGATIAARSHITRAAQSLRDPGASASAPRALGLEVVAAGCCLRGGYSGFEVVGGHGGKLLVAAGFVAGKAHVGQRGRFVVVASFDHVAASHPDPGAFSPRAPASRR